MTPRVPGALTGADLPIAELSSARLDGEVFRLAGSWCPIDSPDTREARAGIIASAAPRRAIAERLTAAWIYGFAPEPAEHQFCVDVTARIGTPPGSGLRLREVRITPDEVVLVAGLPVTSPLRTAVDLARWGGGTGLLDGSMPGERAGVGVLAALLDYAGLGRADLHVRSGIDRLLANRHGVSFTRVADARLGQAFALLHGTHDPAAAVRETTSRR